MGLDMWIYGIKDISNENIPDGMTEDWYEENGYKIISSYDENDEEFNNMFHDMYKYSVVRNVEYTKTDLNSIKKDYDIDEDAEFSGMSFSSDGTEYRFSKWISENEYGNAYYNKDVFLTDEQLCKYDVKVLEKSLIYKAEELAYWRKEYDLQDLIYNEYCGHVYNCGFHLIDDDMMKKINRYLKSKDKSTQSINNDGYIAKMYSEWY